MPSDDSRLFPERDDVAPPLAETAWRRRLLQHVTALGAALVVSPVLIWVCVRYGDWRPPGEGGWGKLTAAVVLVAGIVPILLVADTVRAWPLLRAARRRVPGRWMDAVAFAEDRRETTGNLIFRRWRVARHWWLALYSLREDGPTSPLLAVEVDEEFARRCVTGQVLRVYGAEGPDTKVVLAAGEEVVWPAAQQPRLPDGAALPT